MAFVLDFGLYLILALIAYQDIKERKVSVLLMMALLSVVLIKNCILIGLPVKPIELSLNITLLLIMFFYLKLYYFIKEKKLVKVINHKIGIGDWAFLLIISFLLPFINYYLFIFSGFIISLLAFKIITKFNSTFNKTVPLAGFFSIEFIIMLIVEDLSNFQIMNPIFRI